MNERELRFAVAMDPEFDKQLLEFYGIETLENSEWPKKKNSAEPRSGSRSHSVKSRSQNRSSSRSRREGGSKSGRRLPEKLGPENILFAVQIKDAVDRLGTGSRLTEALETLLKDLASECHRLWDAPLDSKAKTDMYKDFIREISKHRRCFDLGTTVSIHIARRDYGSLMSDYYYARDCLVEANKIVEHGRRNRKELSTEAVRDVLVIANMWTDVETQVNELRSQILTRIEGPTDSDEDAVSSIKLLLELGVDENPIKRWLEGTAKRLGDKVKQVTERGPLEIETLRRVLADKGPRSDADKACYLRKITMEQPFNSITGDSSEVLKFWGALQALVECLVGEGPSLMSEIVAFWETAQGFITGTTQALFPIGYKGDSEKHLKFTTLEHQELRNKTVGLILKVGDSIRQLFSDLPPQDLSRLESAVDLGFASPVAIGSLTSPITSQYANLVLSDVMKPIPQASGNSQSVATFWPPHGLAVGGGFFLNKIMNTLVTGVVPALRSLGVDRQNSSLNELTKIVYYARKKIVEVMCTAWVEDVTAFQSIEDWSCHPEKRQVTYLPSRFMALEIEILSHFSGILFSTTQANDRSLRESRDSPEIVRLLTHLLAVLEEGVLQLLAGIERNVTSPVRGGLDEPDIVIPANELPTIVPTDRPVYDYSSIDTRVLLTMSNLEEIKFNVLSHLWNIIEEKLGLTPPRRDNILPRIERTSNNLIGLFLGPFSIVTTEVTEHLFRFPEQAPASVTWPKTARPFMVRFLKSIIPVHSKIIEVNEALVPLVLTRLVSDISDKILKKAKGVDRLNANDFAQLMVDIELFAKVLSPYTVDQAKEDQKSAYRELVPREMISNEDMDRVRSTRKQFLEEHELEILCFTKTTGPRRTEGN